MSAEACYSSGVFHSASHVDDADKEEQVSIL
jgi:hypothetical protein